MEHILLTASCTFQFKKEKENFWKKRKMFLSNAIVNIGIFIKKTSIVNFHYKCCPISQTREILFNPVIPFLKRFQDHFVEKKKTTRHLSKSV